MRTMNALLLNLEIRRMILRDLDRGGQLSLSYYAIGTILRI